MIMTKGPFKISPSPLITGGSLTAQHKSSGTASSGSSGNFSAVCTAGTKQQHKPEQQPEQLTATDARKPAPRRRKERCRCPPAPKNRLQSSSGYSDASKTASAQARANAGTTAAAAAATADVSSASANAGGETAAPVKACQASPSLPMTRTAILMRHSSNSDSSSKTPLHDTNKHVVETASVWMPAARTEFGKLLARTPWDDLDDDDDNNVDGDDDGYSPPYSIRGAKQTSYLAVVKAAGTGGRAMRIKCPTCTHVVTSKLAFVMHQLHCRQQLQLQQQQEQHEINQREHLRKTAARKGSILRGGNGSSAPTAPPYKCSACFRTFNKMTSLKIHHSTCQPYKYVRAVPPYTPHDACTSSAT